MFIPGYRKHDSNLYMIFLITNTKTFRKKKTFGISKGHGRLMF